MKSKTTKLKISDLETSWLDRIEEISDTEASLISGGAGVPNVEKTSTSSSWFELMAFSWGRALDKQAQRISDRANEMLD